MITKCIIKIHVKISEGVPAPGAPVVITPLMWAQTKSFTKVTSQYGTTVFAFCLA